MDRSQKEFDILAELASISAGNAGGSISKFFDSQTQVIKPEVSLVALESFTKAVTDPTAKVTAIVLKIDHDLNGVFLMCLNPEQVNVLQELLSRKYQILLVADQNYLQEFGNILCGTAINSLSKFLHLTITCSIPAIATDTFTSLASSVVSELGKSDNEVLFFKSTFVFENIELKTFILFDLASTEKVLTIAKSFV